MKIGKYDVPLFADFAASKTLTLPGGKATRQVYFGENLLVGRMWFFRNTPIPMSR